VGTVVGGFDFRLGEVVELAVDRSSLNQLARPQTAISTRPRREPLLVAYKAFTDSAVALSPIVRIRAGTIS
jgi:hypothetical protein